MMQFMQQNAVDIFLAVLLLWMLWMRVLSPRMAGVKSMSAAAYMRFCDAPHTLNDSALVFQ